jgi:hypothetical protein
MSKKTAKAIILRKSVKKGARKAVATVNPMDVIREIKDACLRAKEVTEREETKRSEIEAWEKINLTEIRAKKEILLEYLDRSFDERKKNFEELFKALDKTMEKENLEAMAVVVTNIVDLAKTSPFKDLSNVSTMRGMLKNKDHKVEF